ncbi:MAG: hypothetical protein NWE83_05300 [Candidatus Bathyarchaeota archaeon]|nr:hypothetical protein [Candidatus Bathyarchaeota archaeon]
MRAPIHDFKEFCLIDLGLAEATVQIHVREITKFLHHMKRKRGPVTRQHIRHYLMPCCHRPNVKRKILAALKRYFRDYLEQPDLVKSFKFPSSFHQVSIKSLSTKTDCE